MTLSYNLLIAIASNSVILLVVSWFFGIYIIRKIHQEKESLEEQLNNPAGASNTPDTPDISHMITLLKQEIQEKEAVIKALMQDASDQQTQNMIESLKQDLDSSKKALSQMEKELADGQGLSARIAYLEKSESRLRSENKKMRATGLKLAEKLEIRNKQLEHVKKTNLKLKETVKKLTNASKEQLEIIKTLQTQVDRAEELENYQRGLIDDLKAQLDDAKAAEPDEQDQQKIEEMERQLKELEDKLKRTLIEKDFIESHILELDDSIEKAKETEAALKRAQEEIAALEKQFPEYTPEAASEPEQPSKSISDFDMHKMEEISADNMLFAPLQAYWSTLDMPELALSEDESIKRPQHEPWASITIGGNEYKLFISISPELAQKLSSAIVKETAENSVQVCLEQLGKIMAQPLAEDMVKNEVSPAELIERAEVEDHISNHEAITEMLAMVGTDQIYAVLTSLAEKN